MVHTYVKLPLHGQMDHYIYLSIASYICWKRGFTFLDGTGFAFKHKCPGIPDIYVKYPIKIKDEYGTRKIDQYAIIEIETHSNNKDTQKKLEQFESTAQNIKLCIVPMNKYAGWKDKQLERGKEYGADIDWIAEFIGLYIPQREVG